MIEKEGFSTFLQASRIKLRRILLNIDNNKWLKEKEKGSSSWIEWLWSRSRGSSIQMMNHFCTLTKITSAVTQIVTLLMIAYFDSLIFKEVMIIFI